MDDLVDAVASEIRAAAERAILPRFRALESSAIIEKSPGDWVTDADHEAEDLITAAIASIDPGVPVIGEEAVASDATLLTDAHVHERAWVLDPLDGTKSFIDGSPDFASMVALVEHEIVTASWIWQPVHKRMFTAWRGAGILENGERFSPSLPTSTDASQTRGVLRTRLMPKELRAAALEGFSNAGFEHTPVSAAGVVYPMLLTGELTHALYWRTLPWDHAPGTLMAEEAGLVVGRLDGSPYRPFDGQLGLLSATSKGIWDTVRAALPETLPTAPKELD